MNILVKSGSTHSAMRYVCDKDNLLTTLLDNYDVILVDEMQDLSSAQDLRLIMRLKNR